MTLHRRQFLTRSAAALAESTASLRRTLSWLVFSAMFGPAFISHAFGAAAAPSIQVPAFPGAEGGGARAKGGRGGRVIEVTNLQDSGLGSLRAAIEAAGPRIVVFRVSGLVDLLSDLVIKNSRITIAGQTAPGDGICLKRFPLRIEGADDVVIRYLRVRPGDEAKKPCDGIEVRDAENVMLDHCSVSWSIDEGINTWHGAKHVTVQWCLIAEPLNKSIHYAPHAYGATWGGENCSYHHNLFAHCTARNPSVGGNHHEKTVNMDHRNSVIYNWEHRTCDGKPVSINVVNNYYKPGPATKPDVRRRIVRIDDTKPKYGYDSMWFIAGNEVEGAPELAIDNWKGGVEFETPNVSAELNRATGPFPVAPVKTQTAIEACRTVIRHAGAALPQRDPIDARVLREVETGTATFGNGIIDTQGQVGGWPAYRSIPAPQDRDHDGMPDAWERRHGFDPEDPADGPRDPDRDGYTNIEEYLNGTEPKAFVDYSKPENNVNTL